MFKKLIIILMLAGLSLAPCRLSFAKINSFPSLDMGSDPVKTMKPQGEAFALMKRGKMFLKNGLFQNAMVSFAKAVMTAPQNKKAQIYLINLAKYDQIIPSQKTQLRLVEDLLSFLDNLESRESYFLEKAKTLYENMLSSGFEQDVLNKEMLKKKNEILEYRKPIDYLWKDELVDDRFVLDVLNNALLSERQNRLIRLDIVQAQYDCLRKLRTDPDILPLNGVMQEPVRVMSSVENRPMKIYPVETVLNEEDALALYKRQIALMRLRMDKLTDEEKNYKTREEELSQEIIEISLRLQEKEMALMKQKEEIKDLNRRVMDMESRFSLRQKIVSEKDAQIEILMRELDKIRLYADKQKEYMERILASKDEKLIELNGILAIYKDKLGVSTYDVKAKNADIATLEQQLNYAQKRLYERNQALEDTQANLDMLERQLGEVQGRLMQLQEL